MMKIAEEANLPRAQIDVDYTARLCVSEAEFSRIIAAYADLSRPAATLPGTTLNLGYDDQCAETLDLYGAGAGVGAGRPVFLFIHGGYWRALSKAHSAFMAPMLAQHGIATAVPDYTLAPQASLGEITRQMRAALAFLWHNAGQLGIDRSKIIVGGSSAGGHLAAALAMQGWQADFGLPQDAVHAALPISGLFDLAPIAASHVQDWMHLTPSDVAALSPLRHCDGTIRSHIVVAETETAGFHRQSATYAQALNAPLTTVEGRNHFDVILDLTQADSPLSRTLLGLFAPQG